MKYTFKKGEKLKSRKLIERLFDKGKKLKSFPIQMIYLQTEHDSDYMVQAGFSVPKRCLKKAVDRNRIKRLMREAYRLHKHQLSDSKGFSHTKKYIFMFIYMTDVLLTFREVEKHMEELIERFNQSINK